MKQNSFMFFLLFLSCQVWAQKNTSKEVSLYEFRWDFRSCFELSAYIQDQKVAVPGLDNVYKITTNEGRIYAIGNQGFRFYLDQDSFDFSFDWTEKFVLSNGNYYRGYPLHTYPVEEQKQVVFKTDSLLRSYFRKKPEFIPGLLVGNNELSVKLKEVYDLIMSCAVHDTIPSVFVCLRGNTLSQIKHTDDELIIRIQQLNTLNLPSRAFRWDTKRPIEEGQMSLCVECEYAAKANVSLFELERAISLFHGVFPINDLSDTTGSKGYHLFVRVNKSAGVYLKYFFLFSLFCHIGFLLSMYFLLFVLVLGYGCSSTFML